MTTQTQPYRYAVHSPAEVAGLFTALAVAEIGGDLAALAGAYYRLWALAAQRRAILSYRCRRVGSHPGRGRPRSRRRYGPHPDRVALRDLYGDLAVLAYQRYVALCDEIGGQR